MGEREARNTQIHHVPQSVELVEVLRLPGRGEIPVCADDDIPDRPGTEHKHGGMVYAVPLRLERPELLCHAGLPPGIVGEDGEA